MKILIVKEFAKNPSPIDVRRKFIQHFEIKGRKTKSFHIKQLIRVYEQFEKLAVFIECHQQRHSRTEPQKHKKKLKKNSLKTKILPFVKAREKLVCQRQQHGEF